VQLLPGAANGGGGGSYRVTLRTSDIKGAGQPWARPAGAAGILFFIHSSTFILELLPACMHAMQCLA
jgi:hypothetical protein